MAKKEELLNELLKELGTETNERMANSVKDLADTVADQNEELIATYVEGTKRVIKSTNNNSDSVDKNTSSVNRLSGEVTNQTKELKQNLNAVERAIKGNKVTVNTSVMENKLSAIESAIKGFKFPTKASEAIPVRMSDGKKFIKELKSAVQAGTQTGMGYYVGGAGGGKYAFRNAKGSETAALIDDDKHVQVDVLTMPAVSVDTTGLSTEAKQDDIITAIGSIAAGGDATAANQTTIIGHVDGIETLLGTIDADTGAIKTALETVGGLVVNLGANNDVTVTGSVTADLGANNDVTVTSGTVTANLGAVDNAVLDQIELNQDTQTGVLNTIDADTGGILTAVQLIDNAISGNEMQVDIVSTPSRDDEDFNEDAGTDTHQATGLYLSGFTASAQVARDDAGFGESLTAGLLTVHSRLWDGAAYDRTPGNSTDGMLVNLGGNNDVSLNAGTNNIGDVDVLTVPRSQSGPGQPGTAIDSYTSDDVNLAANTANQSVIAAPGANKQIWVYGLVGTVDVAGSISIQDEDDTAHSGVMPVGITGGFVMNPSGNFSMPWIKVATNKALEIDTVTCTFDGIITYAIVSV